jgi:hypothetical protein
MKVYPSNHRERKSAIQAQLPRGQVFAKHSCLLEQLSKMGRAVKNTIHVVIYPQSSQFYTASMLQFRLTISITECKRREEAIPKNVPLQWLHAPEAELMIQNAI